MRLTLRPWHGLVLAASIGLCLEPVGAAAQSRLPWTDANPLEKLFGKPGETRRSAPAGRSAAPTSTVPALSAVPVPDARPEIGGTATPVPAQIDAPGADTPDKADAGEVPGAGAGANDATAGSANPTAAQPATVEAAGGAAVASPTPEKRADESAVIGEAADVPSAATAPGSDGSSESSADSETAADAPGDRSPVDPATTATKPISEIPVPEERPDAASEDASAASSPAPPSEPPPMEDAPSATEKLKARNQSITPAAAVAAAAAIEDAALCEAELRRRGTAFTVEESISEGDCGVLRPVNVTRLSSGVTVSPKTQMLCRTALALDTWIRDSVVAAAKAELPGKRLTEFRHASTYVCRPRASESGISEHARGSAIDIAAFVFDERPEIGVEAHAPESAEAKFQAAIRKGACGPFKTVLGPGTDADHATHFHLDIAARSNGSTYCK